MYFVSADVTSANSLQAAYEFAIETYAPLPVAIVANNAGLGGRPLVRPDSHSSPSGTTETYRSWRVVVDVCLTAVLHGTQLAIEAATGAAWARIAADRGAQEKQQQYPAAFAGLAELAAKNKAATKDDLAAAGDADSEYVVINVSSMGGLIAMPYDPVYSASKHGVVGRCRSELPVLSPFLPSLSLSLSLPHRIISHGSPLAGLCRSLFPLRKQLGVRVQCLCPSFTLTPLVANQLGQQEVRTFPRPELSPSPLPPPYLSRASPSHPALPTIPPPPPLACRQFASVVAQVGRAKGVATVAAPALPVPSSSSAKAGGATAKSAAAEKQGGIQVLPLSLVVDAMEEQVTQPGKWAGKVCRITAAKGIDAHTFVDEKAVAGAGTRATGDGAGKSTAKAEAKERASSSRDSLGIALRADVVNEKVGKDGKVKPILSKL